MNDDFIRIEDTNGLRLSWHTWPTNRKRSSRTSTILWRWAVNMTATTEMLMIFRANA
jgi:hypothetical protein